MVLNASLFWCDNSNRNIPCIGTFVYQYGLHTCDIGYLQHEDLEYGK
jgi:hypothetical protein